MDIKLVKSNGICEPCGGSKLISPYFIYKSKTYCFDHLIKKLKREGKEKEIEYLKIWFKIRKIKEMEKNIIKEKRELLEMLKNSKY